VKPHFSVVIPVYNRAHMLGRCIVSVLRQYDQDFEIIVVDDGSDDEPESVARSFRDARIRVHRQANAGAGPARNAGIDLARGSFVAFLDSDDVWLPHHLSTMRALLEGKSRYAAYAPLFVDRGLEAQIRKPPRAIRADEQMAHYLLCDRGFVSTCTLVLPTDFARRIRWGGKVRAADDADFAIRLYAAGLRFVMAPEPAAIWNDRYDSSRASASDRGELGPWLENLKNQIPHSAYIGGRGWVVAKGLFRKDPARALRYFFAAVFSGIYPLKLLPIIFLQIVLRPRDYRWLADQFIALMIPQTTPQLRLKAKLLFALC
jgi:glycosyltransferase involved in cell wall biosynthesis